MAIRQHKAPAQKPAKPTAVIGMSSSGSEDDYTDHMVEDLEEKEFHTEDEDEDDYDEEEVVDQNKAIADEGTQVDSEDVSDGVDDNLALPAALLKSKPTAKAVPVHIQWDKLTRTERKSIRDGMGLSMKQLRAQAQGTGVIEAGRAAQIKRGLLPADRVAGSRIAKKRKRKTKQLKLEVSGKQKLIEARKETAAMNGRGGIHPVKKKKR